jgi:Cys-tRNA(Pro) deacylase
MVKIPSTPAIHFLKKHSINYKTHFYTYEKSGAILAAKKIGIDPERVIKSLVLEDNNRNPFFVLMPGNRDVSMKKMAKELCVKSVTTSSARDAQRYTGYKIGGISPFGTRRKIPVFIEKSLLEHTFLVINAGKRGFLVELTSEDMVNILNATAVNVAR